ncbi:MAG: sensor histidine kinase, partial [Methylocella sp.]
NVAELLQEQANVHRVPISEGGALVDAAKYFRKPCRATTRSRLEPIGVDLSYQAYTLPLEPERCWSLGMAVHGLVMSSARHARFARLASIVSIMP